MAIASAMYTGPDTQILYLHSFQSMLATVRKLGKIFLSVMEALQARPFGYPLSTVEAFLN